MDRDRYTGYHTDPLGSTLHREDYYPWDWDSGTHGGGGFSLSSFLGLLIGFVVVGGILLIAYLIWLFLKWMVQQAHRGNGPSIIASTGLLVLFGLLLAEPALAEIPENNLIDQIINQYRNNVAQWAGPITNAATWMFWTLALIEFTWTGALLALRGADYAEVVTEFVVRVMFIGFFAALLAFGPGWAQAIINSLSDIAQQSTIAAGGAAANPTNIFDTGLELAGRMIDEISFWDSAGDALGLLIGSMIVIICFALITAMMILTMVENYIVVQAAIILLGFGPTRWTKEYALRYLAYAGATGMKWFVLLLVAGLGQALMLQWLNQYENNDTQVLLVIGGAVVLLALVKSLPEVMQSILTGVSYGTGQAMIGASQQTINSTRMAGAAGARIATGTAGAGRAVVNAAQLASAQGRTGVGVVSGAVSNLAKAGASEVGHAVSKGRYAGPGYGAGHRISDNMKKKIDALRSEGSIGKGAS